MTTHMLTAAICPVCNALRTPDALIRDEARGGLCCRDRVACLRTKAEMLGLVPRKEERAA